MPPLKKKIGYLQDISEPTRLHINACQLAAVGQIPVTEIGIGIVIRGGLNKWSLEADNDDVIIDINNSGPRQGFSITESNIGYFYEFGPYYDFGHFNVSLTYTDMILSGEKFAAERDGFTTSITYQF